MPTVTTTQVEEVRIEPKLKKKMLTKLATLATLKSQKKALEQAIAKVVVELDDMRGDTGAMSLEVEGNKITLVAGTFKKFNPKKFSALGGDLAIYNQAVEEHPKRPYCKVTLAGDKDSDE